MARSLGIKAKLGFVQGSFPRPVDNPFELARWDRCNNVILSWIANSVSEDISASMVHSISCIQVWTDLQDHFGGDNTMREYSISKDISLLMQGEMNVPTHFGKLLQLWGDEDSYENYDLCTLEEQCKSTKCMTNKKLKTRIQKFLMGLNDIHSQIRSQILATRPTPSLNEVNSLVVSDEVQKKLTQPIMLEASALYSAFTNNNDRTYGQNNERYQAPNDRQYGNNKPYTTQNLQNSPNGTQNNRNRRPLFCTHCQLQVHLKESCYKLVGYSPGHKLYKGGPSPNYRGIKHSANNVSSSSTTTNTLSTEKVHAGPDDPSPSQLSQVQDQLTKLLHMFNQKEQKDTSQSHMAGISCLTTTKVTNNTWILDSGATDHVTPHMHLLFDVKLMKNPYEVLMPNGTKAAVTHTGSCTINDNLIIHEVLLVPDFKFNLLSIGKLLASSAYIAHFVNNKCYIQYQAKHTILGIGDLTDGLYQLKGSYKHLSLASIASRDQLSLWHYRLGHLSIDTLSTTLKNIFPTMSCNKAKFCCDICPSAKQTRLQFPSSHTHSTQIFELIHVDIWGPFGTPTST
ncbi:unnamed protein product [Rhodiola kirilowii]